MIAPIGLAGLTLQDMPLTKLDSGREKKGRFS
jgi:hypothetical protein